MEQDFGSECTSRCESGWTLYLGHSLHRSDSLERSKTGGDFICKKHEDEDDDMSMVSDASSGPPHVQEQEQEQERCNNGVSGWWFYGKRQKIVKEAGLQRKIQDLPCFLDDAASSNNNIAVANNKASMGEDNNIVDYSQGHSTIYSEGKSTFQDHFGLFNSSISGTRLQQNQWYERKR